MRVLVFILVLAMVACTSSKSKTDSELIKPVQEVQLKDTLAEEPVQHEKTYANERFKEVAVEKTGEDQFTISGKAQIFEANFSWVVEDGHYELLKGFEMTDAGAPEWGNFSFTVEPKRKRTNTTLMMTLFEISAKDGSRQHELSFVLE